MVSKAIEIAISVVSIVLVASVLFLVFLKTQTDVSTSAPGYVGGALPGLSLLGKRKKGVELTVNMVATIILVLVGALLFFAIFRGVASGSVKSTGNFFYSIFDAIIKGIPLVGG